jgi:hypothetical protein
MQQQGLVGTIQTMSNPVTSYYTAGGGSGNGNFNSLNVTGNITANNLVVTQNIGANNVDILYNFNVARNTQLNNLNIAGSLIVNQNTQLNTLNVTQNIAANNLVVTQNVGANNMNILYNLNSSVIYISGEKVTATGTTFNIVVSNIPVGSDVVLGNFQGPYNGNCLCSLKFTIGGPVTSNLQSDAIALVIRNVLNASDSSAGWATGIIDRGTFPVPYQYQLFFPNMQSTSNYSLQTTTVGSLNYNATTSIMGLSITKLS